MGQMQPKVTSTAEVKSSIKKMEKSFNPPGAGEKPVNDKLTGPTRVKP